MKKCVCLILILLALGAAASAEEPLTPVRLRIPALDADSDMVPTHIEAGELQVADGYAVSYWGEGPRPGDWGNALLAVHNMWDKEYTPYAELPDLPIGAEVIIDFSDGSQRAFTVDSVDIYETGKVPSALWRGVGGARFVSMISCAGKYSRDMGTHDHRCVITFSMPEHELLNLLERHRESLRAPAPDDLPRPRLLPLY